MKKLPFNFGSIALMTLGFVISLALLCVVELIVRHFFPNVKNEILGDYSRGFNMLDPNYGYRPKPDSRVSAILKGGDGEVIYSVHYSTDEFSRRVTPSDNGQNRDKFAIFFGCSFTFGQGLDDNQTLPYFVGKKARCYAPYNYGYSGYGPQQMLIRLQDADFVKQIKQKNGILIYSPAHVARAIGTYKASTSWARDFPFFSLDNDGNLKNYGSFQTGRPFRSWLFGTLSEIRLIDALLGRYDFPRHFSALDIQITSKIIEKSFEIFNDHYPGSTAYFMLLPGVDESDQAVAANLRKAGIRILDFSSRDEFKGEGYVIPNDGHPTELWNQQLANLIVEKLEISGYRCSEN